MSDPTSYSPLRRTLAWGVHAYTALGVVCGLFTAKAILDLDAQAAFRWMLVALLIDSTDGVMARAVDVKHVVPEYDGRKLDDITDYLNYVFLPIFFALRFQLVPSGYEFTLAFPLLASAYGFCSSGAKTADGYFTGFPSYWNVTIFYLFIVGVRPMDGMVLLVYLSVMVFVPIRYLYPSQSPYYRKFSMASTAVWFGAMIIMMLDIHHIPPFLVWGSLAFPAYYFGMSFYLHLFHDRPAN
jgi:phosphatidylcholine synthase